MPLEFADKQFVAFFAFEPKISCQSGQSAGVETASKQAISYVEAIRMSRCTTPEEISCFRF
ncbi:MAG: hypothetical protein CMM07_11265 [Rhodopirellula sp.]|nr:hypothetical protein [Rhodopirellula sp.]